MRSPLQQSDVHCTCGSTRRTSTLVLTYNILETESEVELAGAAKARVNGRVVCLSYFLGGALSISASCSGLSSLSLSSSDIRYISSHGLIAFIHKCTLTFNQDFRGAMAPLFLRLCEWSMQITSHVKKFICYLGMISMLPMLTSFLPKECESCITTSEGVKNRKCYRFFSSQSIADVQEIHLLLSRDWCCK